MDSVITFAAQYLLFIMVAAFAAVWLFGTDQAGKLRLAAAAVIGLALAAVFLVVAGKLHSDPRPFVQNPRLHPLFQHARDNGFPSDHSVAAGLITGLVLCRSRLWGAIFALAAFCVAASRVAAHVHHAQDVVAGLILGGIAAAIGYYAAGALLAILQSRTTLPLVQARPREPARHAAPTTRTSHHE
ncbi:MAG TPA: phosphatase PAP2 family protein [Streptosporangiaceae bacterium]|nr:phosphatase PAP2 family protein [Streptosporangiaceae bacterium]